VCADDGSLTQQAFWTKVAAVTASPKLLNQIPRPCLLALAFCMLPQLATAKDFLWRVQTNDSVVYLAGSFHRLRASDISAPPFPIASLEQAFAESQQVAFEANPEPEDMEAVDRYYFRKAVYPLGGGSLRSTLSATTYLRVRNLLIADGAPPQAIDRFKPWFVALILSDLFARRRGFESEHGIDTRYYELAGAQGKTRLYLESPYQHVNVLAATPQSEWAAGIGGLLADRGNSLLSALEIYKSGDVEALRQRVAMQARREPGITRGLLVNRNLRWLPTIEMYLQQSKTTMVVVGAAHMVRPTGLVALLKNRGYDVVQLPEDGPAIAASSAFSVAN
jgi:uncharacterized protein YbaP (TraB family)